MSTLVVFVEGRSEEELLKAFLPRVVETGVAVQVIPFEGKSDLEGQVVRRIRGWCAPDSAFVVLRDQDSAKCEDVKARLRDLCAEARRGDVLVRIACRATESWFLGELAAVERALKLRGLARQQAKAKYRDPDRLGNPDQELGRLTGQRYQKVSGARAIGAILGCEPSGNQSRSFGVFVSGVRRLLRTMPKQSPGDA